MFIKEIIDNWRKIFIMSIVDFKSQFKASVLTWFWVVINPALTIGMYLFSFAVGGENIENTHLISFEYNQLASFGSRPISHEYSKIGWLIIGVLTWTYVGSVLSFGSQSTKQYSWMVTKIGTPLSTPPALVTLSRSYIGILSIIVSWFIYMIIAASYGNQIISLNILQLPLMIVFLFSFLLLWSLVISPLTAISKDVYNVVLIIPILLQWITGVFLPLNISQFNEPLGIIFRINPFSFLLDGVRGSIIGNSWFWNDWVSLISFFSFFILFFSLASFLNKRSKKLVVDLV